MTVAKKKTKKTKKPKKPNLRKLVKKAFSLWSECARLQHDNKCEMCGIKNKEINSKGKPTVLNVHHACPRENKALRFDLHNAIVLCVNDHKYGKNSAHKGSIFFYDWFKKYRPSDYEYIFQHKDDPPVETIEQVQNAIIELELTREILLNKVDNAQGF